MAISEFEIKKCERALKKLLTDNRPPPHIRKELDFGYRIENQNVVLFEISPDFRNPEKLMEQPVAKATFVKTQKVWKIYWQRQDLKWHSYEPAPEVKHVEGFLAIVSEDACACFFG